MTLSNEKESLSKNICDGCPTLGLCCCHAVLTNDDKGEIKVYLPSIPCKFLDTKSKLCTVYKDRFEKNPDCHSMISLAKKDAAPPKCHYIEKLDFRLKRARTASPLEERKILIILLREWVKKEQVPQALPEALQKDIKKLIALKKDGNNDKRSNNFNS